MERGLIGDLCYRAFLLSLGTLQYLCEPPWVLKHIPVKCYLHETCKTRPPHLQVCDIEVWLRVGDGPLTLNGTQYSLLDLQLNSAIAVGGDAMKLAARLHGQCEIHCYVEGPNRAWLASLIEDAFAKHIFRTGQGWEETCTMLRKSADSPVVCSFSV